MKCFKCGKPWNGYGKPRSRQICEGCGAYVHTCLNCHHFDRQVTRSCKLPHTAFIGSRDSLNYCEEFEMVNSERKAIETRGDVARLHWAELFGIRR